jgi:hypothetical protein
VFTLWVWCGACHVRLPVPSAFCRVPCVMKYAMRLGVVPSCGVLFCLGGRVVRWGTRGGAGVSESMPQCRQARRPTTASWRRAASTSWCRGALASGVGFTAAAAAGLTIGWCIRARDATITPRAYLSPTPHPLPPHPPQVICVIALRASQGLNEMERVASAGRSRTHGWSLALLFSCLL